MEHRTKAVVAAGKTLKILSPQTIGVLLFVIDDGIELQTEMADKLDCSASPITTSLQSLEDLPVPLVSKRGSTYEITPEGEAVIGLIDESAISLGIDLCDIDWSDDADKDQLGTRLDPLHSSRSLRPFFVLDSISERGDLPNTSHEIQVADVVSDVQSRQQDQEEVAGRKQIRWTLGRFEEAGLVELDGASFTVKEKGRIHVRMLNQFINFYETILDIQSNENKTKERVGFSMEYEIVLPAYCLSDSDLKGDTSVLPFTPTTTIQELFENIFYLTKIYDGKTEFELNWVVCNEQSDLGVSTKT